MAEQMTAEIIPFPMPARPIEDPTAEPPEIRLAMPAAAPVSGERLTTALTNLSTALSEQQQAVKRWRAAMENLADCMQRLSVGIDKLGRPAAHP